MPDPATAQKAKEWEDVVPGSGRVILAELRKERRHDRNLARLQVALSALPVLSALVATLALVWLAKYFVDHQAPTQGATVVGSSLAAVIAAFLGSKLIQRKKTK
jgi:hypothetical protein